MAKVVDLYQTLQNIDIEVVRQREIYGQLESLESGTAAIGDEAVPVPALQLANIKQKLTIARGKYKGLAEILKVEVVYKEIA